MPEFPYVGNPNKVVTQMSTILAEWLSSPLALERARSELTSLYNETVIPGASAHAAEAILSHTGAQISSKAAA